MFTRARGADVSLRDVTSTNDVTHRKRAEDLGIFWKSQLVELKPASGEHGWLSLARGGLGKVSHEMGGGRWKSQNRKNVYLSPYVKQPLNSKVIKSFLPELSRKCFSCFEIPMFYVYIYMNIICPFRISISGYGKFVLPIFSSRRGLKVKFTWKQINLLQ